MTRILAIETSTNACSAALWADGGVAARRFEPMVRGHAERLMPMVAEVMAEAAAEARDLDLVAVTVGPGAFTGIRVGLAAARGRALAAGVPCLGATTMETMAWAADPRRLLLVALDSKRDDLYVQVFGADRAPLAEPAAVAPADLGPMIERICPADAEIGLAGDAAARARDLLAPLGRTCRTTDAALPDAADLAALAAARWRPGDRPPAPAPLYLRPPDAVVPTNGGRLRP